MHEDHMYLHVNTCIYMYLHVFTCKCIRCICCIFANVAHVLCMLCLNILCICSFGALTADARVQATTCIHMYLHYMYLYVLTCIDMPVHVFTCVPRIYMYSHVCICIYSHPPTHPPTHQSLHEKSWFSREIMVCMRNHGFHVKSLFS